MQSSLKSLAIAALLASVGFAASAQPMEHGGSMGMHGKMDPAKMEAMMSKHQTDLKAKLKLSAEQEGAWTTFTAAMKPAAKMDHKRPDRAEMAKLSTPERIDKMRALRNEHMTAMNAAMDKRDEAIKIFYSALNADQKKVFDAEHARMGSKHGERHRHHTEKGAAAPAPATK